MAAEMLAALEEQQGPVEMAMLVVAVEKQKAQLVATVEMAEVMETMAAVVETTAAVVEIMAAVEVARSIRGTRGMLKMRISHSRAPCGQHTTTHR